MADVVVTKRCYKCKETKQASEFYRQRRSRDGLQDECKSCERNRRHTDHTRAKRNAAALRYQKTENGKSIWKRASAKIVGTGTNSAHQAVYRATKAGTLRRSSERQCHYCQKAAKHYHHHLGYSKEHHLDVLPVCAVCHKLVEGK